MANQSKLLCPSGSRSTSNAQSSLGRSATTKPSTTKRQPPPAQSSTNDASTTANKENNNLSRSNRDIHVFNDNTKPQESDEKDDEDGDNTDADTDYHDSRAQGKPMDRDDDTSDGDDDDDGDDEGPARGRTRRVSVKQAQREEEQAQKEARKLKKAEKAVKLAKKKAGEVEEDTRGPINDDFFTSHPVESRPTKTKNLAQRTSRVPAPPKFPSDEETSASHRDSHGHTVADNSSLRHTRRSPSFEQPRDTFRGRSPSRERVPARAPIRNINGGIVPDTVTLHLVQKKSQDHQRPSRRVQSRSPSLQNTSGRHRPSGTFRRVQSRSRSPQNTSRHHHPSHHLQSRSPMARSSSPAVGNKRRRSPSEDSDDLRPAQSQRTASGRPRAKDLDDHTKEYVVLAIDYYRCLLSAGNGFPDNAAETEMVQRMGERLLLTPTIAKLISSRGSQLRGELKTKIKPLVDLVYGFKSGQNKKTIAFNRKLAEELKEGSAFAFKHVKEKTGLYKNRIFQMVINAMWFANRRDEGPSHPEIFDPFPVEGLGLVLSAVENNIDEHLTGDKNRCHLKALKEFAVHTEKYQILDKILASLHKEGRFHSGAQPVTAVTTATFSKQILDAALKEYEHGSTTEDDSEMEANA
ncbi:hypothetical protein DFH09DRAFT_1092479 [Mycena vulgaris]|nr:hypothetical protein DFH09DRAFT_1092479 [Mycena vulgaris]